MDELSSGLSVTYYYERPSRSPVREQFAELMHYAVKKADPYLQPACITHRLDLNRSELRTQGMTVNRGRVNCKTCLWMMGSSNGLHPSHKMTYVSSDVCRRCLLCVCHYANLLQKPCENIVKGEDEVL